MALDLDALDLRGGLDFDRDLAGAADLQRQLDAARAELLAMLSPRRQNAPGSRSAPPAPDIAGPSDPSAGGKP